jgi:SAM-dependent methyltransferase
VGFARQLYGDPAQRALVDEQFKFLLDDPAAIAALERDDAPIPATEDREGYFGERHLSYWFSGLADLRVVQEMVPASALANVLDFGGANGRFARHVALACPGATVTVADISLNHIDWVDEHFGPAIRGVKLSPYPHFPIADRTVTLCVGLSVFTHIDSYETGWLAEIHRVLADGGYAFLTIHSEDTWQVLSSHPRLLSLLNNSPEFTAAYDPPRPMPRERMAFAYNPNSIEHNCNVFVTSDYVRRRWGKWFEVVEIRPRAHHGFQTVVVLRKHG